MPYTKEEARVRLTEFTKSRLALNLADINEENTKNHLDDLFRILGWDISLDTVKEESAGRRKRVDYSFKIDGATKFLLEAKAYGKNLDDHVKQALNYAYQQNKKWVVLSNLKEIRIYNAQYYDKAEEIRLLFRPLKIEEFSSRFDDLWLLSREAFGTNTIDEYAKKTSKIKPTEPIDRKLYEDLMRWRNLLTKSINSHPRINTLPSDPDEASAKIDEAVQKILDRLIFVRVAEDRGLEDERSLEAVVRRWRDNRKHELYRHLKEFFRRMDEIYNSGLFLPHYSEDLDIDDEILETIIEESYKSRDKTLDYDFSAINADILGTAYEQYLGTLLRKTAKRTSLKSSKAKRKEMGIYYTPTYIVDYIVKNTLGEKLKECKKPEDVLKLKVLDPACGSGSFLIRAYDEFREWYKNHNQKGEQTTLDADSRKGMQTFMDKVLENCIYGVDLDPKAVEMAQLNLLLKSAEGRHKLPKLDHTIQCGNSLIDDSSVAGKFAFKWEEKFPEVFRQGGFDVVIGNPPYINAIQLTKSVGEEVKAYWKLKYSSAKGTYDIYLLFFEQSLKVAKKRGLVSFITPNKYLSSPYGAALREYVYKNHKLSKILDLSGVKVFDDPSVYPIITLIENGRQQTTYTISSDKAYTENLERVASIHLPSSNLSALPEYLWGLLLSKNIGIIQKAFAKGESLENVAEVQATSTAAEADEFSNYINDNKKGISIINTGTIDRYSTTYGLTQFMNKGTRLSKPRLDLSRINDTRRTLYKKPKIIISKLALRIEGFLDSEGTFASINTNCIHSIKREYPIEYLCAIINSKLLSFVYSELFSGLKMSGGYFQFQAPQFRILPIANASKDYQNRLVILVNSMVLANKHLQEVGENTNEGARIKEEIKKTDAEIDELVYRIYEITEDEKKIIEESLK